MTTLFDALVATASELDALHENAVTGGTTTTVIDSLLDDAGWQSGDFLGGTMFIIRDAGGLGAAPEQESRPIIGFTIASALATFEVLPAFSVSVAPNDWYGAATNRYPRGLLVSKVREALRHLGLVPTVDITSLTTASDQLEYSLPALAKRDLRQVWLARSLTAPWDWEPLLTVRTEWSAAGAVGNLLFATQPRSGYKVKLIYLANHGVVQADSDVINDYISLDWLGTAAALGCARFRLSQAGSDDKTLTPLINDLMSRERAARHRMVLNWPQRFPTFAPNLDGALPT